MVKGVTANVITNNPGVSDDMFQLNLDGQQVTQKISGGFGQPRFSRESIAEFQIVTNMFDITQGRSAGMQVQAISRSGTQHPARQLLRVLPRRQAERARPDYRHGVAVPEPADWRLARRPDRQGQAPLLRVVRVRARARHDFLGAGGAAGPELHHAVQELAESTLLRDRRSALHEESAVRSGARDGTGPTRSCSPQAATPRTPRTRPSRRPTSSAPGRNVLSDTKVQQLHVGYNNFQWANQGLANVGDTFEYDFPGPDPRASRTTIRSGCIRTTPNAGTT